MPYAPSLHVHTTFLIISIPCQDGEFVTVDEPTSTYHCHLGIHSGCFSMGLTNVSTIVTP